MTILFEKKNTKKKKLTRVKLQAFKSIIAIFRPNFICALVIFNVHVHRSAFVHLYAYFKIAKSEEKKNQVLFLDSYHQEIFEPYSQIFYVRT